MVITRNRREELLAILPRLLRSPGAAEVIVIDNGSDDGTVVALPQHPRLRVVALSHNRGAAGRNVGVALATTPYVAFADDDSWWEVGAFDAAADVLDAHPRLALVAARVVVGHDRVTDPVCDAMHASPLPPRPGLPGPSVLGFVACGAVVRVDAFSEVGGFDESFGVGGEERLLATDLAVAGWWLCYLPSIVAVHVPSPARDRGMRRRRVVRNDLWHVWLRRRPSAVVSATARALLSAGDDAVRRGLTDALRALPGLLRRRRAIPIELERQFRLIDSSM